MLLVLMLASVFMLSVDVVVVVCAGVVVFVVTIVWWCWSDIVAAFAVVCW